MKDITLKDIRDAARPLVLRAASEAIPGEAKMDKVLDELVEWLDKQIRPKQLWAEKLTDWVIRKPFRWFVELVAQEVFDELRAAGEV